MLSDVEGLAFALAVSFLAVLVHYEGLRFISVFAFSARRSGRVVILAVVFSVLAAHLVETAMYAAAYWSGVEFLNLGHFRGSVPRSFLEYYYFALETYTTQSVGDLYPVGRLRVMASLEPLIGLILIGWSASLTFIAMRRYWRLGPTPSPTSR